MERECCDAATNRIGGEMLREPADKLERAMGMGSHGERAINGSSGTESRVRRDRMSGAALPNTVHAKANCG
jgi:hypothetical protein